MEDYIKLKAQSRAVRYLALKQHEQNQKLERDVQRTLFIVLSITVCLVIYKFGAL